MTDKIPGSSLQSPALPQSKCGVPRAPTGCRALRYHQRKEGREGVETAKDKEDVCDVKAVPCVSWHLPPPNLFRVAQRSNKGENVPHSPTAQPTPEEQTECKSDLSSSINNALNFGAVP